LELLAEKKLSLNLYKPTQANLPGQNYRQKCPFAIRSLLTPLIRQLRAFERQSSMPGEQQTCFVPLLFFGLHTAILLTTYNFLL
jgi:hypothetical protein